MLFVLVHVVYPALVPLLPDDAEGRACQQCVTDLVHPYFPPVTSDDIERSRSGLGAAELRLLGHGLDGIRSGEGIPSPGHLGRFRDPFGQSLGARFAATSSTQPIAGIVSASSGQTRSSISAVYEAPMYVPKRSPKYGMFHSWSMIGSVAVISRLCQS
ncbi:hypothetical protein [Streptomyces atratus]|uniref:hypothetical protein n=1 Tax=Streptomyces atratus TaxID=1893 RepID=UPI0037B750B3